MDEQDGAACPTCGARPPEGAAFCPRCGARLRHPGSGVRVTRKECTILFGDLVGFTPTAEGLDIEDVRELQSRYFQACRTVIGHYGGTTEKFIGDAVMAVWGVPVVHEDDPERAVRAGLELTATVAALGDDLGIPELALRVGVVTGEVAVSEGVVGEGMVAGDAVNTAARVQARAVPGHVWVDATTRGRALAAVSFTDRGRHALKGKAGPELLFEAGPVLGAVAYTERLDGVAAPLVGRARELDALVAEVDAAAEQGRPRLVVLTGAPGTGKSRLAAELEIRLEDGPRRVDRYRGHCPSYGSIAPYSALTDALRERLCLTLDADAETVDDRIRQALDRVVDDGRRRAWLAPRLAALLGGASADSGFGRDELFTAWTDVLGSLRDGGAVVLLAVEDAHVAGDALLDFLEHAVDAADFPLVVLLVARPELLDRRPGLGTGERRSTVALDPLDTAAMEALVDGLIAGLDRPARRLLVRRAEGLPLFATETVRTLIDQGAIVPAAGRWTATPDADRALTEGSIPGTLRALVAARLDALDAGARELLLDAAVVGDPFTPDTLTALGHPAERLSAALADLRRRGLLVSDPGGRPGRHRFAQDLLRTVAYRTLSRRDRRARHLAVAEHLESLPDPAHELAAVVAIHLLDGLAAAPGPDDTSVVERAVALLQVGARRALDIGAPLEAREMVDRASGAIGEGDPRLPYLDHLAGGACFQLGDFDGARTSFERAIAGHAAAGRTIAAARSAARWTAMLIHYSRSAEGLEVIAPWWRALRDLRRDGGPSPGQLDELDETELVVLLQLAASRGQNPRVPASADLPDPISVVVEAMAKAERRRDTDSLVRTLNMLALLMTRAGARRSAIRLLEQAADAAEEGEEPAIGMLPLLNACASHVPFDLAAARRDGERALALGAAAPVQPRVEYVQVTVGLVSWLDGDWEQLRALLREVRGRSVFSGLMARALRLALASATGRGPEDLPPSPGAVDDPDLLAWKLLTDELERDAPRAPALRNAIRGCDDFVGSPEDDGLLWTFAADAVLETGALEVVQELVDLAARAAGRAPLVDAQLRRVRGELAAERGVDPDAAEVDLRSAIEALDALGVPFYAARARLALAPLLAAAQPGTAAELRAAAAAIFARLGATRWQQAALEPGATEAATRRT